jgi:hypothetical protein
MAQFHTFMAGLRGCGFSSAKGLVMFPAAQFSVQRRKGAAKQYPKGTASETAGWHSQELKLEVGSWRKWEVGWLLAWSWVEWGRVYKLTGSA